MLKLKCLYICNNELYLGCKERFFIASTVSNDWIASHRNVTEVTLKPPTRLFLVLLVVRCTSFLPCETFSLEYTSNTPCIPKDLQ